LYRVQKVLHSSSNQKGYIQLQREHGLALQIHNNGIRMYLERDGNYKITVPVFMYTKRARGAVKVSVQLYMLQ